MKSKKKLLQIAGIVSSKEAANPTVKQLRDERLSKHLAKGHEEASELMNNLWNPDKYNAAWHFATLAHGNQTYKRPQEGQQFPYINHLASVAMEVSLALAKSSEPYDADLAIQCALLHDTIEDTDVSKAQLSANFGEAVANGVMALSKNPALPKPEQMADSLQRICQQPQEVWMVKMADRITNLSEPPFHWDEAKIVKYQQEARQIHQALHRANNTLAMRLQEKIDTYSVYLVRSP